MKKIGTIKGVSVYADTESQEKAKEIEDRIVSAFRAEIHTCPSPLLHDGMDALPWPERVLAFILGVAFFAIAAGIVYAIYVYVQK